MPPHPKIQNFTIFATADRTRSPIKPAYKTLKRTIIRFRYNHVRFKI